MLIPSKKSFIGQASGRLTQTQSFLSASPDTQLALLCSSLLQDIPYHFSYEIKRLLDPNNQQVVGSTSLT